MNKQERTAIEAVAKKLSATWEESSSAPDPCIIVNGQRIAVDVVSIKRRPPLQANAPKPRLRFDKAVTQLMDRLQATSRETVPDGVTVLLAITSPIRLGTKTAAVLEGKIQMLVARGSRQRDETYTIHENRVRIRSVTVEAGRAPKLIGFVHNPDTDPLLLFTMTRELLGLTSAQAGTRWLVVISSRDSSHLAAYRYIHSQLPLATGFQKVLMVFGDGCVGVLGEC